MSLTILQRDKLFYPFFCDSQWNFSVKDTSDEVRLIFHMWIALFYSRSVPRFIEFDSDPSSLEKTPAGSVSTPPHPDLGVRSFAPDSNLKDTSDDTMSRPLDLSTNGTPTWDQKSVILDLSKNNSPADISTSVSQVATKEACETPKTPLEFHARTPFQVCLRLLVCVMSFKGIQNNCIYFFFPFPVLQKP